MNKDFNPELVLMVLGLGLGMGLLFSCYWWVGLLMCTPFFWSMR